MISSLLYFVSTSLSIVMHNVVLFQPAYKVSTTCVHCSTKLKPPPPPSQVIVTWIEDGQMDHKCTRERSFSFSGK